MVKKEDIRAMGKSELRELLRPISRREASDMINEIIAEKRAITLKEAKYKQIVFVNEVHAILFYFGFVD